MEPIDTGTLNIGMKYKNGVLLLTDRQITLGDRVHTDIMKIETIGYNVGLAFCGGVADCQALYRELMESYHNLTNIVLPTFLETNLKNVIEQVQAEKEKAQTEGNEQLVKDYQETIEDLTQTLQSGDIADRIDQLFDAYPYVALSESPAENGQVAYCCKPLFAHQVPRSYSYPEEEKIVHLENHILMHNFGRTLVPDVASIAHFTADLARFKLEEVGRKTLVNAWYLVAGCDAFGPHLFQTEPFGAVIRGKDYFTNGNGGPFAQAALDLLYKEDMTQEEALQIAVFSAIKAAERMEHVNEKLDALLIETTEDGSIKSDFVPKEVMMDYRNFFTGKRAKIQFIHRPDWS